MAEEEKNEKSFVNISITDAFGFKTLAEGICNAVKAICSPAAEELALLLKDHVHAYRLKNLAAMIKDFEKKKIAEGFTLLQWSALA